MHGAFKAGVRQRCSIPARGVILLLFLRAAAQDDDVEQPPPPDDRPMPKDKEARKKWFDDAREAATTAHADMDDVAKLLGSFSKKGQDILGGGSPSSASTQKRRTICPDGKIPAPKLVSSLANGILTANGCGPQGMVMKEPYGLWRCCNRHDVCYSSCGASFEFCEKQFKQCMKKRCKQPMNREKEWECEDQAKSMSSLTGVFGKEFHSGSAKQVCDCMDSEQEAKQRLQEWVHDVYRRFGDAQKAANETFMDGLVERHEGKEGKLIFDLLTTYGGADGFVQFLDIPNTFELEGPSGEAEAREHLVQKAADKAEL
mmetsp:Transcript_46480/g.85166  ORF Transcript_46480/g.85166 Transcript_46480/m.85166 type:complete len:315 (+) Transcript_46480:46-990(+)